MAWLWHKGRVVGGSFPRCEPSCKARGRSRTQHSPPRLRRGRTESCWGARAELKRDNFVLTSFWWISIKSGINLFKMSDPREAVRVMEATGAGAGLRFTLPQSPPWLGNKPCSSLRHIFHSSLLLFLHQQHQEAKPVSDNATFFRKAYFHCKQTDLHQGRSSRPLPQHPAIIYRTTWQL